MWALTESEKGHDHHLFQSLKNVSDSVPLFLDKYRIVPHQHLYQIRPSDSLLGKLNDRVILISLYTILDII